MQRFLKVWCFLGVVTFVAALYLFPSVYPILHLSITMNRNQALQNAAEFVQSKGFQTAESSSVAMFAQEEDVQNFAELAGGGKDAFVEMFEKDYYQPYYWKVRFYKEQAIEETEVIFTPQGKLYGYTHKVSEKTPGVSLSTKDAQKKAEEELAILGVDFSKYALVEHTQDEVVSKRLDHVFTYERTDVSMKDGKYRVTVKIAGDQVISCKHFLKVPDSFIRMFQEMRSSNGLLGLIGTLFFGVYIFILGAFIAYLLYKTRYLSWQIPFYVALGLVLWLRLSLDLNTYSSWGFGYQTHMSYSLFIIQQIVGLLLRFFYGFALVFLVSLLGEGITRMARGNQVQLWDFLKRGYLRSTVFVEHVAWAYGFVGLLLLYKVVFTFVFSKYAGWWFPASDLSDVNILSAFVPWVMPITISFQAGFLEELLCRAIPLGLFLWFVPDIKKRPGLFFLVMLAQAIIFGLAHATYPVQPCYARVIELIIDSFCYGYLYCFVGLIPGIITHYVYDALLFSIPLFISDFIFQKIMALLFILLPVLLALYSYARGLIELDSIHLNRSWNLFYKEEEEKSAQDDEYMHMPQTVRYIILACGIFGIFGAYQYRQTSYDTPVLEITKADALRIGQEACEKSFNVSLNVWEKYVVLPAYYNSGLNFIWKTYGKEAYEKMYDRYGWNPAWIVRFIRFDTDVAHRAEEYQALVGPKKDSLSVKKIVPEAQEGACLHQEQAAQIAYDFVKTKYGVEKSEIELISAFEKDHVHRKDWNFIFKDAEKYYSYDQGQGRLEVNIAGDVVVRSTAQIYPGEEWLRSEQAENTLKMLLLMVLQVFVWMLVAYAWLLCAWKMFKRIGLSRFLLLWLPLFLVLALVATINSLPYHLSTFNTIQPYMHQIMQMLMFSGLVSIVGSVGAKILGMSIITQKYSKISGRNFLPAIEFGFFLYAVASMWNNFFPRAIPAVSSYDFATSYSYAFGLFNSTFSMCLLITAMYLGLVYVAHLFSGMWLRSGILFVLGILSVSCMLLAQNINYLHDIPLVAMCLGSALFAGYYFVFRYDLVYVFVSFAVWFALDLLQSIFIQDIPGSGMAYFIALILFAGASICMLWLLEKFSYRK